MKKTINDKEKDLCKQWITKFCTVSQRISTKYSSYLYKHFVEGYFDEYIPNSSFISACRELGIRMKPTDDSCVNYYFALKVDKEGICQRV